MNYWVNEMYNGWTVNLVNYLSENYEIPKGILFQHIKNKNILINHNKINPSYRLKNNDHVIIKYPLSEKKIQLSWKNYQCSKNLNKYEKYHELLNKIIIYEDDNLIVLNKPYGWATQDGSKNPYNIDDLLTYFNIDHYIIHRLDKETTGVLIMAKNHQWASQLSLLLKNHHWQKFYQLKIPYTVEQSWSVKSYIPKEFKKTDLFNTKDPNSLTNFVKILDENGYSWVEAQPITGKKHQIRIHSMLSGKSIVGDEKYNGEHNSWLHLHCCAINFTYKNKFYEYVIPWSKRII